MRSHGGNSDLKIKAKARTTMEKSKHPKEEEQNAIENENTGATKVSLSSSDPNGKNVDATYNEYINHDENNKEFGFRASTSESSKNEPNSPDDEDEDKKMLDEEVKEFTDKITIGQAKPNITIDKSDVEGADSEEQEVNNRRKAQQAKSDEMKRKQEEKEKQHFAENLHPINLLKPVKKPVSRQTVKETTKETPKAPSKEPVKSRNFSLLIYSA